MPVFTINGKNVLFIHIPKTGGTTVENTLSGFGPMSLHNRRSHFRDQFAGGLLSPPIPLQHLHGTYLQRMFDEQHFDLIFTIVRDPVARMISEYRHSRERRRLDAMLPFGSWLRISEAARRIDRSFRSNHLRPQSEFLFGACQVYHYEDGLLHIVNHILRQLDLPKLRQLSHNRTSLPYPVKVTPADTHLIERAFAADYALFSRYRPEAGATPVGASPAYLTGGA